MILYPLAASEGGANVFEVSYFKGKIDNKSLFSLLLC